MLIVEHVWDEVKEIFGHCNEAKLLRKLTDAVELLANKGEIDPLVGFVDLCVDGRCVTLPREVETPLAVNIGGHPSLGRDEFFSFHLNGLGDFRTPCNYSWSEVGNFPTYRDLRCPAQLICFVDKEEDAGKKLRVFGFDNQNRPLRSQENGIWVDGYLVPTIFGYAVPASDSPTVSRITAIRKDLTAGSLRLSSYDNSSSSGTLLGVFEPDELVPSYRRLVLHHSAQWVRLCYRRRTYELLSLNDRILLHSRPALLLACRAIKKYDESNLAEALGFEAQATRLLTEKESAITAPTVNPIQVDDPTFKLRGVDDID